MRSSLILALAVGLSALAAVAAQSGEANGAVASPPVEQQPSPPVATNAPVANAGESNLPVGHMPTGALPPQNEDSSSVVHPTPHILPAVEEVRRPDFEAIQTDCANDFARYCPGGRGGRHHGHHMRRHHDNNDDDDHHHHRRHLLGWGHHHRGWRHHGGRHHGRGHHHGRFRCIQRLRQNWTTLETTCKATLTAQLPCMTDAVQHCPDARGRHEVMECLGGLENGVVSTRCAAFMQWAQQRWGDHHHHHEHEEEEEEHVEDSVVDNHHGKHGEDVEVDEDENENEEDVPMHHEYDDHHPHLTRSQRRHLFFMIGLVALFSAMLGACCTLCCVRRHRRRFGAGGGGCCRGAHQHHQQTNNSIPLQQIPRGRATTGYAVFQDEVARGAPVSV